MSLGHPVPAQGGWRPFDPQGPPLPSAQSMSQQWRDIAFVHWRVDPDRVAPMMPRGVRPDVHDGATWVGLIPFRMVDAGVGRGPAVPWLGTFLETNVRLYSVDDGGRRGVVFRSLEAERLAVVLGARLGFGVPYQWASMTMSRLSPPSPTSAPDDPTGTVLSYGTRRLVGRGTRGRVVGGRLDVEVGAPLEGPDPLAHFLTSRFGLHTSVLGRSLWVPNSHGPWPLRRARVVHLEDTLVEAAGLPGVVDREPDSVLFSTGTTTVFGLPTPV